MIAFLLIAFVTSTPGHAAFEVRANFAHLDRTPRGFNAQMQDYVKDAPALPGPGLLGLDGIYRLPVLPLSFGLRREVMGLEQTGRGSISGTSVDVTSKLEGSRTSVLLGWDFFHLPGNHLSLVASYAVQQSLKYRLTSKNAVGAEHVDSFEALLKPGYGLALEAGLKIGFVVLATELGYTVFRTKAFKQGDDIALDQSRASVQMDLSGGYWRILAGIGF